eukprot:3933105-Prymnesium_polylepis.1
MEERSQCNWTKKGARHADIGHATRNGTPRAPTPSLVRQPTAKSHTPRTSNGVHKRITWVF